MLHYGEVERTKCTKRASHQSLSSSNTSNFVWAEPFIQHLPPWVKRQEPCVLPVGLKGPSDRRCEETARGLVQLGYYPHIVQKRGLESWGKLPNPAATTR